MRKILAGVSLVITQDCSRFARCQSLSIRIAEALIPRLIGPIQLCKTALVKLLTYLLKRLFELEQMFMTEIVLQMGHFTKMKPMKETDTLVTASLNRSVHLFP